MNEIRQLDDEEDLLTVGNSMIIPEDKTITLENVFFSIFIQRSGRIKECFPDYSSK